MAPVFLGLAYYQKFVTCCRAFALAPPIHTMHCKQLVVLLSHVILTPITSPVWFLLSTPCLPTPSSSIAHCTPTIPVFSVLQTHCIFLPLGIYTCPSLHQKHSFMPPANFYSFFRPQLMLFFNIKWLKPLLVIKFTCFDNTLYVFD